MTLLEPESPLAREKRPGTALGVVGHRLDKLSTWDLAALHRPVEETLDRLLTLVSETRDLVVVTSLAEGADRLVAGEAISRDIPIVVVLPFPRDIFRNDFQSESSMQEFDQLLTQAAEIIEPDGDCAPGESGYSWASMLIVEASDVLIAIWDGAPGRGPGGTAVTIDEALIADIPVIWIRSHAPYTIDIVDPLPGRRLAPLHHALQSLRSITPNAHEITP